MQKNKAQNVATKAVRGVMNSLSGDKNGIVEVKFAPDGTMIAFARSDIGTYETTIRGWDGDDATEADLHKMVASQFALHFVCSLLPQGSLLREVDRSAATFGYGMPLLETAMLQRALDVWPGPNKEEIFKIVTANFEALIERLIEAKEKMDDGVHVPVPKQAPLDNPEADPGSTSEGVS